MKPEHERAGSTSLLLDERLAIGNALESSATSSSGSMSVRTEHVVRVTVSLKSGTRQTKASGRACNNEPEQELIVQYVLYLKLRIAPYNIESDQHLLCIDSGNSQK